MSFIRGSNPIWSIVDLQGHQFDDSFYMFVLQNVFPYLPATVYHQEDGVPWNQPIRFFANGTLPVDIFFDPGSTSNPNFYRLEFRRGPTQSDPLIYLVENYLPGTGSGSTPTDVGFSTDNQFTNPQFSIINFTSPLIISSAISMTIEIAPGWFLDLNTSGLLGSANVTVVPLNNSVNTLTPSNAPYALRLTLNNWTLVTLRQRFTQNGVEWAGKNVAFAMTAKVQGAPQSLSAVVIDSQGAPLGVVLNNKLINGTFNEVTGHAQFPTPPTNSNVPPAAYIEFELLLTQDIDLFVTSLQLVAGTLPIEPSYEQDTIERQVDHMFHYFYPLLAAKPIPSFLAGWDFAMNPAQFGETVGLGLIGAGKSNYLWDQTIFYQQANNSVGVSRDPLLGNILVTTTGTTQFAMIQYLSGDRARQMLINNLSVMLRMTCQTAIPMTVSLWYTTGSIPIILTGTNESLVTSLDSTGFPTVSGSWIEIKRRNTQHATFTAPQGLMGPVRGLVGFNGWDALDVVTAGTANAFAIVIGTGSITNVAVQFDSVSVVPGDVPTIPAPQSEDEVLRECEHYYEMSYNQGSDLGQSVTSGALTLLQSSEYTTAPNNVITYPSAFTVSFRVAKRAIPVVNLYSITGAITNVRSIVYYFNGVFSASPQDVLVTDNWTPFAGLKECQFVPGNMDTLRTVPRDAGRLQNSAAVSFHYTADARLGIVP